ncbi:TPR repeat-containing thioredoxin TTL1 [Capsicum galapagoense]
MSGPGSDSGTGPGSGSRKSMSLADQFRNTTLNDDDVNKPDSRELNLAMGTGTGSPVSTLRTRIGSGLSSTTTSSSSSSSSGSVSGRNVTFSGHSGELKTGHGGNISGSRKSGSDHSGDNSGSRKSGSGHTGELKPVHGGSPVSRKSGSDHSSELKTGHGGSPVTSGSRKSGSGHSGENPGLGGGPVTSPGNISSPRKSGSGHSSEPKPSSRKSDSSHSGELKPGSRKSDSGHSGGLKPGPRKSGSGHGRSEYSSSVTSPTMPVLPAGNICPSGKLLRGAMLANKPMRSDIVGSGQGSYGHGTIMPGGFSPKSGGVSDYHWISPKGLMGGGDSVKHGVLRNDPEEFKRAGNENYKKGNFGEALNRYDKGIAISPENAALHCNRAAALIGLKRYKEAVKECQAAIRLDPSYIRAHQRLGSIYLSLGQVEDARRHYFSQGFKPDQAELQMLQAVEKHIKGCTAARKLGDWKTTLKEAEAATFSGAVASPQLFACRAEAHLKLHQLGDAEMCVSEVHKHELLAAARELNFFGMFSEAYILSVQAQIHMAFGRFENALTVIERAANVDPRSAELVILHKNVRMVVQARARGNELFRSERYTEASIAYGEGLARDSSNSILYCNRAACWYKLEEWEKSLDDCNHALHIQPYYTKALLRRAGSNFKLERWAEAVRDYEVLRRELPHDNDVTESLLHAQAELKKSHNMNLEEFRDSISSSDVSVVHFIAESNPQCKQISPFLDTLSTKFPSIRFLKVDVEEVPTIAAAENVTRVPTFKIYKTGIRMMEMVKPSPEMLESSIRHYSS